MYEKNFADYEMKEFSARDYDYNSDTAATKVACVGNIEHELNTKTVTKSCEGVVVKSRTRGDGTGTLTVNGHFKYSFLIDSLGMERTALKKGIVAYGKNSKHKEKTLTAKVTDEDENVKYVAYPNATMTKGHVLNIENGAEEVAQIEMEFSLMPDEYGECYYEALEEELSDEPIKSKWLTNFNRSLIQVESV